VSFDLPTFFFQTANFLVLVFVLWRLMWKPLRKHMEERRMRIAEDLRRVNEESEQVKKLEEKVQKELRAAEEARIQTVRRAELAAETRRQELLDEAHEAARVERDRILAQVAVEQKRREDQFLRSLTPLVGDLLIKLLDELGDDASLHQRSCARFAEHLLTLDDEDRDRIRRTAGSGDIELVLARQDAPPELNDALAGLLPGLAARVQTDRSLVAGACLRVGEIVLDGTVRSQVARALERP